MNNDQNLAMETCTQTLSLLKNSGLSVRAVKGDPSELTKQGSHIWRIRIIPTDRKPSNFWSQTWCFYEIGIGRYPSANLNVGGVQFVMFPDNAQCGSGRYRLDVMSILRSLHAPADVSGFFNTASGGAKGAALLCGFHQLIGPYPRFVPKDAATNLAWLIAQTLPRFSTLN